MRAAGRKTSKIGTVLSTRPPREAAAITQARVVYSKEHPQQLKSKKRAESGRAVGRRRGPLKAKPAQANARTSKSPVKKMEVLHHDLLLGAASRLLRAAPACFKTKSKDFRLPLIK
jgi:hypothetical protein